MKKEEIVHISKLSKLKFNDEEIEKFKKEFENILSHFNKIKEKEYDSKEEDKKTITLRKDIVKEFKEKERLFKNTKEYKDGYIIIPKILE